MDDARTPLMDGSPSPFQRSRTVPMVDHNPSMNIRLVDQIANQPSITAHGLWELADLPLDQEGSAIPSAAVLAAGEGSVNPGITIRDIWNLIQGGAETSQLIKKCPGMVTSAIKLDGVRRLGDMKVE
ncbi:unnamed protein product, partial [Ostreobium quekettii]